MVAHFSLSTGLMGVICVGRPIVAGEVGAFSTFRIMESAVDKCCISFTSFALTLLFNLLSGLCYLKVGKINIPMNVIYFVELDLFQGRARDFNVLTPFGQVTCSVLLNCFSK